MQASPPAGCPSIRQPLSAEENRTSTISAVLPPRMGWNNGADFINVLP